MIREEAFDRIARAYLAEGPTVLADRVLDAALEQVGLTRQRRFGADRRTIPLSLNWRLATAVAVALVIVVAGAVYVGDNLSGPIGAPIVTPSPDPIPATFPPGPYVPLAAGTYRLGGGTEDSPTLGNTLLPALRFTVGNGWRGFNDAHSPPAIYKMGRAELVFYAIAELDVGEHGIDPCGRGPRYSPGPMIDGTADSVIAWLIEGYGRQGMHLSGPISDVVVGGLPARSFIMAGQSICEGPVWAGGSQTTGATIVVEVDGDPVIISYVRLESDSAVQQEIDAIIRSIHFDPQIPSPARSAP